MRWLLITAMAVAATAACAQTPVKGDDDPPGIGVTSPSDNLPDAPSQVLTQQENIVVVGEASLRASGKAVPPCNLKNAIGVIYVDASRLNESYKPCSELVYPYQRFLNANVAIPITSTQKGYLALHEITDPANLAIIGLTSGITIAADSHSAYGPGLKGFGKIFGVTLLQVTTGEFFGVYLVPSIVHQDPRYYRMPEASIRKRLLYSISRTFISRNDNGRSMPNYGTLLAYPIVAETSNLYVPGIETDGPSTVKRIATGLALDPVNNLLVEFLPDVAKHIHVRVIFVQQILNKIASSPGGLP